MRLLEVAVGDLWPGSYDIDNQPLYWPELSREAYDRAFEQLEQNPNIEDTHLELYPIWHDYLRGVYGRVPTKLDTPIQGRLQRWEFAVQRFRAMQQSFAAYGYQPERIGRGEQYLARISSEGRVCIYQGNKRVALLRRMNKNFKILMQVLPSLGNWESFKLDKLYPPGKDEIYQPLEHPDFQHYKPAQPCTERWKMMAPYVEKKSPGTLLDLGCHTGWFCRRFQELGWTTLGIDSSKHEIRMANIMQSWSPRCPSARSQFLAQSVQNTLDFKRSEKFDAVLCLSLVMHLFPEEPKLLYSFLDTISKNSSLLFMDCGWGTYAKNLPFTEEEMGEAIARNTRYETFKILGQSQRENRPLYLFER